MSQRAVWWIALGLVVFVAWQAFAPHRRVDHLSAAAEAFAAGRNARAARLLRQVEPREMPSRPYLAGSGPTAGPPRVTWPPMAVGILPLGPHAAALPTGMSWAYGSDLAMAGNQICHRLAAAEYAAGRPERAAQVLAAGLGRAGWNELLLTQEPAVVYRQLISPALPMGVPQPKRSLLVLDALIAREAARHAPDQADDQIRYARAIQAAGSSPLLPSARSAYEAALRIEPNNLDALLGTGRVDQAISLYPDDVDARRERIQADSRADRPPRREDLETVVRVDPEGSYTERRLLMHQALIARDYAAALRHLDLLNKMSRSMAEVHPYLVKRGWILAEMGHLPEAIACYTRAQKGGHPSRDTGVEAFLGVACLQARDVPGALRAFRRVHKEEFHEEALVDLFVAWCEDQQAPSGALARAAAKQDSLSPWRLVLWMEREDDFTRQAERILALYPDCFPAALLLAGALKERADADAEGRVAARVRRVLDPFRSRFPELVARLERTRFSRPQSAGGISPWR